MSTANRAAILKTGGMSDHADTHVLSKDASDNAGSDHAVAKQQHGGTAAVCVLTVFHAGGKFRFITGENLVHLNTVSFVYLSYESCNVLIISSGKVIFTIFNSEIKNTIASSRTT